MLKLFVIFSNVNKIKEIQKVLSGIEVTFNSHGKICLSFLPSL